MEEWSEVDGGEENGQRGREQGEEEGIERAFNYRLNWFVFSFRAKVVLNGKSKI